MNSKDLNKIQCSLYLKDLNTQASNLTRFLRYLKNQTETDNLIQSNNTKNNLEVDGVFASKLLDILTYLKEIEEYNSTVNILKFFEDVGVADKFSELRLSPDTFSSNSDSPENIKKRSDAIKKIRSFIDGFRYLAKSQTEVTQMTSAGSINLYKDGFNQIIKGLKVTEDSKGFNKKYQEREALLSVLKPVKEFLTSKEIVEEYEQYSSNALINIKSPIDDKSYADKSVTELKRELTILETKLNTENFDDKLKSSEQISESIQQVTNILDKRLKYEKHLSNFTSMGSSPYNLYLIEKIKKLNTPIYTGNVYLADATIVESSFNKSQDKLSIPLRQLMAIEKNLDNGITSIMIVLVYNYLCTLMKTNKLNKDSLSKLLSEPTILDDYFETNGKVTVTIDLIKMFLQDSKFLEEFLKTISFHKMTLNQLFEYLCSVYTNLTAESNVPGNDSKEQLIQITNLLTGLFSHQKMKKIVTYEQLNNIFLSTLVNQLTQSDSESEQQDIGTRFNLNINELPICFYNKEYSGLFVVSYYQNEALGDFDNPSFEGFKNSTSIMESSQNSNLIVQTHLEWLANYRSSYKDSVSIYSTEDNYPKLFKDTFKSGISTKSSSLLQDNNIKYKLYTDEELSDIITERIIFDTMKMPLEDKIQKENDLIETNLLYKGDEITGFITEGLNTYNFNLTKEPIKGSLINYTTGIKIYNNPDILLRIGSKRNDKEFTYNLLYTGLSNTPSRGAILTPERSLIIKLISKYISKCRNEISKSDEDIISYITPFTLNYIFEKYKTDFLKEYYVGLLTILKDINTNLCDEFIGGVKTNPAATSYVTQWLSQDPRVIEDLANNIPAVDTSVFKSIIAINSSTIESILNFFVLIQKAHIYKNLSETKTSYELVKDDLKFEGFFNKDGAIKSEFMNLSFQDIWGYAYIKDNKVSSGKKNSIFTKVSNINLTNGNKYDVTRLTIGCIYSLYGLSDIVNSELVRIKELIKHKESEVKTEMTGSSLIFTDMGTRIGSNIEGITSWSDECKKALLKNLEARGEQINDFEQWYTKYVEYISMILNSLDNIPVNIDKDFMICLYVTNMILLSDPSKPLLNQLMYQPIANIPTDLLDEVTPSYVNLVDLIFSINSLDNNIRVSEVMLDVEGIAPASTEEYRNVADSFCDSPRDYIYDQPIINTGLELLTRYIFEAKGIADVSINAFIRMIRNKETLSTEILLPDLEQEGLNSSTAQKVLYNIGLPSSIYDDTTKNIKVSKINLSNIFDINIYKQDKDSIYACAVRDIVLLKRLLNLPKVTTLLSRPIKDSTQTKFANLINQGFTELHNPSTNPEDHKVYNILKQKQVTFNNILTDEMINNTWAVFKNKTAVLTHHPIEVDMLEYKLYDVVAETTYQDLNLDNTVFKSSVSPEMIDEAKNSLKIYSDITTLSNSILPFISMMDFLYLNDKYKEAKKIISDYIDVTSKDTDKESRKARIIFSMALRDDNGLSMLTKSILDNIDFKTLTSMEWLPEQVIASPYSPREQLVQYNLINGTNDMIAIQEKFNLDSIHLTVLLDYCLEIIENMKLNGYQFSEGFNELYSKYFNLDDNETFKQNLFSTLKEFITNDTYLNSYRTFKNMDIDTEYYSILSKIETYLEDSGLSLEYLIELPVAIRQYVSNYEFGVPANVIDKFRQNQTKSVLRPKYVAI